MNIQDALYHARYQHLRNVLTALGPLRVAKAMTAFEDGKSNWSHCFFARAFEGELNLNDSVRVPDNIAKRGIMSPEWQIMNALKITTVIPIRLTWQAFDRHGHGFTREKLKELVDLVMSDSHTKAVDELLKSVKFDENLVCEVTCGA